jgi:hypothetical protein
MSITTRYSLEQLLKDDRLVVDFSQEIKLHGFAIVSVTKEYEEVFKEQFKVMNEWYSDPSHFTGRISTYDQEKEIGFYINKPLGKEFFAVGSVKRVLIFGQGEEELCYNTDCILQEERVTCNNAIVLEILSQHCSSR